MDEIDGAKVGQCPYCGYQLVRCGNESPGKDKDGNGVIVRDLFLACPHCGYRGPIAATWAEAMQKNELVDPERNKDDVEQQRIRAIESYRVKILAEIEKLIKLCAKMKVDKPFEAGSVEELLYLRDFDLLNKFKILAVRGDGWREIAASID